MRRLADALQRAAVLLRPHRDALLESWILALTQKASGREEEIRRLCTKHLDNLLQRLSQGEAEAWLRDEAERAEEAARKGSGLEPLPLAIQALQRGGVPYLVEAAPDREFLLESLLALDELTTRRLEILLLAQEEESARRLVEAQEQAARAEERARDVSRANEALRRSERQSQRRADQIGLLASVAQRISAILDPDQLMQVAAQTIQGRMDHTYVAVVVLDNEGVLVGRWAGRPGVGRRSGGRAQGPPGGIIGRAIRRKAPQVVGDVGHDPDYRADVSGTRSEMVVPLLEYGVPLGAIDYQSEQADAFDLDDVAAGEVLSEFVVIALRNARLFAELRRQE